MGLIKRLFGREERAIIKNGGNPVVNGFTPPANWEPKDFLPMTVGSFFSVGRQDAGIPVDEYTALTAGAVYSAVNCIASTISTLPIRVLKTEDSAPQKTHPVAQVLASNPNEFMSASTFWTCMMANALLWGHGTAYVDRGPLGEPAALYPLRSAVTRPIRWYGELLYVTQVGEKFTYLRPDQVFSIVNFSIDGITPISPIQQAKQTVGLSLALERYAAKFFSNGGNVGGILSLPPGMKEAAIENFVETWRKNYGGPDNALKVAMLPDGYKFTPTTTEPEKAQALQARVNQLREVARIFRIPPHKLGDLERATFSNIEQLSIEYLQDCIQPWCVKIEQEAERKLLLEREKGELDVRFDFDAMLRADTTTRNAGYTQGLQGGWLSPNDVRRKEGYPPIPGGDTYLQPLNMMPVGAKREPAPPANPAPATRTLIEDTARRVLTKESKAVARAAKKYAGKPDEFRTWAETFYTTHAPLVTRAFTAPLRAAGLDTTADDYAKSHCAESVRALTSAVDAGAGLEDLADEWTDVRPGLVADQLLTKQEG